MGQAGAACGLPYRMGSSMHCCSTVVGGQGVQPSATTAASLLQ